MPPHSSYLFKHALVQDAAYGTLLRARRQELHARVAAVLEQHFADLVERQPELLAHHLTAAGDTERAVDQWLKAGQHAAARSAPSRSDPPFRARSRGIGGTAREAGSRRTGDRTAIGPRPVAVHGRRVSVRSEAAETYTRARELAEQRGDPRQQFMAVYGLWQSANGAGGMVGLPQIVGPAAAIDRGQRGRWIAPAGAITAPGRPVCLPASRRPPASTARRGAGSMIPSGTASTASSMAGTTRACAPGYMGAQAHWLLGYPETGLGDRQRSIGIGRAIAHPFSLGIALLLNAMLHLDRGEPELALQRLEAAEALAAEQRLGFVLEPQLLRGAVLTAQGAFEDAVACLRDGLASRPGDAVASLRPGQIGRGAGAAG